MTAKRALYIAAAGCALAGIVALLAATMFLIRLSDQIDALTTETTLALHRAQVAAERAEVDLHLLVSDLRMFEQGLLIELTALNEIADRRTGEAVGAVAGLARNANDSWDDVFWDLKATLESAAVAARGVAEASEAAGRAAPAVSESAQTIADEMAQTMQEIREVAPRVAENLKQISTDVREITGEAARVAPETAEALKETAIHTEKITRRLASPWRWVASGIWRGIKKVF